MRWFELLPLALLALLIFGPKRMPEIGASVGKTIREFQKSIREVTGGFDGSAMSAPEPAQVALPPTGPDLPAAPPAAETPAAAEPASGASAPAEPVSATTGSQPGAE